MSIRRTLFCLCGALLCSGCHMLQVDCRAPQDYQQAKEVPVLRVPAGTDSPEVKSALVIPAAALAAPPAAQGGCLDKPPRFKRRPHSIAAGSSG
ncbi:MAG TPA: hypothetical protein VMV25_07425 [Steroidobacteraceae bacterium]|nr:hypothetical protein [Steroidobacteraceae bacterium]